MAQRLAADGAWGHLVSASPSRTVTTLIPELLTAAMCAAKYYASGRSTDGGLDVPGQYDRYRLTIGYVLNTTSLDTVKQWIADAQAKNTWLILCYHGVNEGKPDETYNVSPATFAAQLAAVKTAGIPVVTVRDGLRLTAG